MRMWRSSEINLKDSYALYVKYFVGVYGLRASPFYSSSDIFLMVQSYLIVLIIDKMLRLRNNSLYDTQSPFARADRFRHDTPAVSRQNWR